MISSRGSLVLILALAAVLLPAGDAGAGEPFLVADLGREPASSHPSEPTAMDGRFAAFGDVHGRELWVCDGTPEGTRVLKDLEPEGSSDPRGLTVWGDRLLFTAETETLGREPWISDGTADGTLRRGHRRGSTPESLTDVPYRLKVTDTVTGAVRVYSNPAGRLGGFGDVEAFADGS